MPDQGDQISGGALSRWQKILADNGINKGRFARAQVAEKAYNRFFLKVRQQPLGFIECVEKSE